MGMEGFLQKDPKKTGAHKLARPFLDLELQADDYGHQAFSDLTGKLSRAAQANQTEESEVRELSRKESRISSGTPPPSKGFCMAFTT